LRASAIATSASARVRTISAASALLLRRLADDFGPDLTGRPNRRAIPFCFGFLIVFGLVLGIATVTLHSARHVLR
jgi:hypothetical protein